MFVIITAAVATVGAGLYLHWAAGPAVVAFRLGRRVGYRQMNAATIAYCRQVRAETTAASRGDGNGTAVAR